MGGKRTAHFFAGCLALTALSGIVALTLGSFPTTLSDVAHGVLAFLTGNPAGSTGARVVSDLRLPRFLLGLLTGGALAASGAVFQTVLTNPLADPYILGVSGGAAVGSVVAFVVGGGDWPLLQLLSFAGAALGALAVYWLAGVSGRRSPGRLILMGVIVGALMNAVILVLLALTPPGKVPEALFWLMGDLSRGGRGSLAILIPLVGAGFLLLLALSRGLDVMLLGDEEAAATGLSVESFKGIAVGVASLLTGTVVAFTGLIGFVGLIIPHVVRRFTGGLHSRVLPGSFLAGGAFLVLSDAFSRILQPVGLLPVGAVTALVGAPFFIVILRRRA